MLNATFKLFRNPHERAGDEYPYQGLITLPDGAVYRIEAKAIPELGGIKAHFEGIVRPIPSSSSVEQRAQKQLDLAVKKYAGHSAPDDPWPDQA
jgi:hypothetical protein